MQVVQTLSLAFAPIAFGACEVDFARTNISEPVATDWLTVDTLAFITEVAEMNVTTPSGISEGFYSLWSVIAGGLLLNSQCLGDNGGFALGMSSITNAGNPVGSAMLCLGGNDPQCPAYRMTVADCATSQSIFPNEYCVELPECSDLYTTAVQGVGPEISVKWNANAVSGASSMSMHQGYGCQGAGLVTTDQAAEGACEMLVGGAQGFHLQKYSGLGRSFADYGSNFLQYNMHLSVCTSAYNVSCLGSANEGATGFGVYSSCLGRLSCAFSNGTCADGSTPGDGSDSDSDSSSAFSVAPVALLAAGAFLF